MSGTNTTSVAGLPALAAIDCLAVLEGARPGASLVPSDAYYRRREAALSSADAPELEEHRERVLSSQRLWDDVYVDFDDLTTDSLREASRRLVGLLQGIPEIQHLQRSFSGTSFAVPEWLRTPAGVEYGARVYFFDAETDSPSPREVLDENIAAVVEDDREAFEAFLGDLHGYPECCVSFFQRRSDDAPPPEVRSVESLADLVDEERLGGDGTAAATPLAELFDGLLEHPRAYAFFTREFYPEPDCEAAARTGVAVYDQLVEALPEWLVRDFVRFNYGYSYLEARSVERGHDEPPEPGALGREGQRLYWPLETVLSGDR